MPNSTYVLVFEIRGGLVCVLPDLPDLGLTATKPHSHSALRHEAGVWFNDGSRGSGDAGAGHERYDGRTLLQIGAWGKLEIIRVHSPQRTFVGTRRKVVYQPKVPQVQQVATRSIKASGNQNSQHVWRDPP